MFKKIVSVCLLSFLIQSAYATEESSASFNKEERTNFYVNCAANHILLDVLTEKMKLDLGSDAQESMKKLSMLYMFASATLGGEETLKEKLVQRSIVMMTDMEKNAGNEEGMVKLFSEVTQTATECAATFKADETTQALIKNQLEKEKADEKSKEVKVEPNPEQ